MDARSRADELIESANAHLAAGRVHQALPLYREAASLFPAYASFELVAADELYRLGRLDEAAEGYRRVTDGVPEHEQAWQSLALVLYELGRADEADQAMLRHDALAARLQHGDGTGLIERYWAADDLETRAEVAEQLLRSLDEGAAEVLHDFLKRSRRARPGVGPDVAGLQAAILVRFGMADFVYWYSDGPVPDRQLIAADIDRYLAAHRGPPVVGLQQPVLGSPPPAGARWHRRAMQRTERAGPLARLRGMLRRL